MTTAHWTAFDASNTIGDPGRQPEIRPSTSALNVGLPDTALDFLTLGPLELRACSSRGWSHRYAGTPRQDSYSVLANDDLVVVAVADGVSEGIYSQVAAETAARSACKLVAEQMSRTGAVDWVQLSRRISLRVIEEAEYRQISTPPGPSVDERLQACLARMATTLLVAVVGLATGSEGLPAEIVVVAGDSAAYVIRDGEIAPVSGGKDSSGPITSSTVRPLPGPTSPEVTDLVLRPGDVLVLGTDGIGDPIGDGSTEMGREIARRWHAPPGIDEFLRDVNVFRRSYDDDRTAIGLWVRPDLSLPEEDPSARSLDAAEAEEAAGQEELPPADADDAETDVLPVATVDGALVEHRAETEQP